MTDPAGLPTSTVAVDIAVLYERLGYLSRQMDALADKIDRHAQNENAAVASLEARIDRVEADLIRARGFIAGIAAAGGALGGTIASVIAQVVG